MAIRNKKETAWKKNRKFGDVKGGRQRVKMEDNIFNRAHNLKAPGINDNLPIVREDNPSRDFFFPLTSSEVLEALRALPEKDYATITHLWLRRISKGDYGSCQTPLAEFICGSGVRLIVLYPWPKNMMLAVGMNKPDKKQLKSYERWTTDLQKRGSSWFLQWKLKPLRHFYIQYLLYHEVGHHIDWYQRHWSGANRKVVEAFADQYAMQKTATARHVFNRLEKKRAMEIEV